MNISSETARLLNDIRLKQTTTMQDSKIPIETASVKVMRSFDYCHFEISLTTTIHGLESNVATVDIATVDELRKTAARLADKAVEQYKVAKQVITKRQAELSSLRFHADIAEEIPDDQRSPEQKAAIKAYGDALHASGYDYQDDWNDEDPS